MRAVPAETWEFVSLADFAKDGHLPVPGGVLSQSASFMEALRAMRSEEARWKAQAAKEE